MSYLNGLNERQKEAVLHKDGPLLIIAGAGAGKTKTITHRIAHLIELGVSGHSILAVTFTNKAAGEMRDRVRSLKPQGVGYPLITTFHSLGVRLLREFHTEANVPRGFAIWDRDDSTRAIKRILESLDIGDWTPRSILSAISREKGNGTSMRDYARNVTSTRARTIARAWELYEKVLTDEGALDFDDLLARSLTLLQQSPEVLSRLQNRWPYITIDEYQDTNKAQYEMARLLAGPTRNICVVGDIDQNIYSWRGADIEHLLSFEESFPGAKVITLEQNYRSTRTILAAANSVIVKNIRRKEKNLFTENPTGDPIALFQAQNEIEEAWFIAHMAQQLAESGTPLKEMAILYRENFQSRTLEEAFLAFGISYRVLGTRFFERKEVKDVLSYLRASLNPKSRNDMVRIVSVPPRGIGKVTLDKMLAGDDAHVPKAALSKVTKFRELMTLIAHAAHTLPCSDAVRYTIEATGIEKMFKENDSDESCEHLGNVRELVNVAIRYDEYAPPEGIERLLEEAALESEQDQLKGERDAVSLMTVHASKGLEFDTVFITGLEQGLFPAIREHDHGRDTEEERRLFYVALTRARTRLFLTYAGQRMRYGSREFTLPSEFLNDIDNRLMTHAARKPKYQEEQIIE